MEAVKQKSYSADALLAEFFAQDDLKSLAADAGALLDCPLLVLDDTFHVVAYHRPLGFSDPLFQASVSRGEITYEAGAIISRSEALMAGTADYVKLEDSVYRRRFVPLISSGVRLGFLICVDTDGHLQKIPQETWNTVEQILAKQAFIETSRHDKPFETAEDILMHLLDGGFSSALYFQLQASGTYLADFHPTGFALIDLTAYHDEYLGKRHLKDELGARFPQSHSFLYRGDVFLFLYGKADFNGFSALAKEFELKVVLSDDLDDLFSLPGALPHGARGAGADDGSPLSQRKRLHGIPAQNAAAIKKCRGARRFDRKGNSGDGGARQEKGYAVLRNALPLPDLLPFAQKNLRRALHPS